MNNNKETTRLPTATDIFLEPRARVEDNLVNIMYTDIMMHFGPNAAKQFLAEPIISTVINANAIVQRISINRYILQLLLIFSNRSEISISDTTIYIVNDATNNDWISLLRKHVLPFMVQHNVFPIVYGQILMINQNNKG